MAALSTRLMAYLGGLTVTQGDREGQPFTVLPWERRFIRGAFSTSGDAALTVARGNGKSALVAGIAAAVADPSGPLHGNRREVVCVAASFDQSRIVFDDVLAFLGERHDIEDRRTWRKQDSANRAVIEHRPSGARVRCIGSDPAKAHGLRPALALCDEPAQWDAAKADRMHAAIRTGLGKMPGSRLIALGTRPDGEGHWFERLRRTAAFSLCYAAGEDDPPFRVATWRRANPSIDHLPTLRARIAAEATDAKADGTLLPGFKALRLNLGTSDVERAQLLEAGTWAGIEADDAIPEGRYALGVDLGSGAAMSAAAAYWPGTGRLAALAAFPSMPSLAERGIRDGVGRLYVDMAKRGELLAYPGRVVPVDALLAEVRARWGAPAAIAADRWREAELRQGLADAGFPLAGLSLRGQGFRDGAEDVREFRRTVLRGKVRPGGSLLLRAAMAEAVVVADASGNEKLAKGSQGGRRARARDDAAAAAILAVAEGARRDAPRRPSWNYRGTA